MITSPITTTEALRGLVPHLFSTLTLKPLKRKRAEPRQRGLSSLHPAWSKPPPDPKRLSKRTFEVLQLPYLPPGCSRCIHYHLVPGWHPQIWRAFSNTYQRLESEEYQKERQARKERKLAKLLRAVGRRRKHEDAQRPA
ncbi:hypothetical protein MKEN_00591300 [Mycena kentingensis (nom. inval.)]|nr:hypothetical protein MKEN_00591300 [Mycena kentingensis (nom. inval.)]